MSSLTQFWIPSVLIGVGIAIDIAIATIARFHDKNLTFKNWTLLVTISHIVFPAIGYYIFWGMSDKFPDLRLILGVIGFTLVTLIIYEVFCESVGIKALFSLSNYISETFGFKEDDSRRLIAILAVSWDALASGPAIAAQASASGWSADEVLLSFFIAGITVAIIAEMSLTIALELRRINFQNIIRMAHFYYWGKYAELSVIGGFGVLSLWHGLTGDGNLYQAIVISAALVLFLFSSYHKDLIRNEMLRAKEAFE